MRERSLNAHARKIQNGRLQTVCELSKYLSDIDLYVIILFRESHRLQYCSKKNVGHVDCRLVSSRTRRILSVNIRNLYFSYGMRVAWLCLYIVYM